MRNLRSRSGPTTMTINGKIVNRCFAKIVYRCRECLGKLDYCGGGLACEANRSHSGFVHRDEAAKMAEERTAQLIEIQAVYEIVGGKIVTRGQDDD